MTAYGGLQQLMSTQNGNFIHSTQITIIGIVHMGQFRRGPINDFRTIQ